MMNWRSCLYDLATYQLCLQKKDKIVRGVINDVR